jgi:hypothetical protein
MNYLILEYKCETSCQKMNKFITIQKIHKLKINLFTVSLNIYRFWLELLVLEIIKKLLWNKSYFLHLNIFQLLDK